MGFAVHVTAAGCQGNLSTLVDFVGCFMQELGDWYKGALYAD